VKKPIRRVKGQYGAAGHSFDDDMICLMCRTTYETHQASPRRCKAAHLKQNCGPKKRKARKKTITGTPQDPESGEIQSIPPYTGSYGLQ